VNVRDRSAGGYKGNAPALNDLLGGQVSIMFDTITTALPHVKIRMRTIGVTPMFCAVMQICAAAPSEITECSRSTLIAS
jgi:hypothetical protein